MVFVRRHEAIRHFHTCLLHILERIVVLHHLRHIRLQLVGLMSFGEADKGTVRVVADPHVTAVIGELPDGAEGEIDTVSMLRCSPRESLEDATDGKGHARGTIDGEAAPHDIAADSLGKVGTDHDIVLARQHFVRVAGKNTLRKDIEISTVGHRDVRLHGLLALRVARQQFELCVVAPLIEGTRGCLHHRRIVLDARSDAARRLVKSLCTRAIRECSILLNDIGAVGAREVSVEGLLKVDLRNDDRADSQAQSETHDLGNRMFSFPKDIIHVV